MCGTLREQRQCLPKLAIPTPSHTVIWVLQLARVPYIEASDARTERAMSFLLKPNKTVPRTIS